MGSGMDKPIFDKEGICEVKGFEGRCFELKRSTWEEHILRDKTRWFLKEQFDKVLKTLKNPDCILRSPHEKNVVSYVKKFNDLYILNSVTAITYLYVMVNLNNNNIRTVYTNPRLKNWEQVWPKK